MCQFLTIVIYFGQAVVMTSVYMEEERMWREFLEASVGVKGRS